MIKVKVMGSLQRMSIQTLLQLNSLIQMIIWLEVTIMAPIRMWWLIPGDMTTRTTHSMLPIFENLNRFKYI